MTWETLAAIIGFTTGVGSILYSLFVAGRWVGKLGAKIAELEKKDSEIKENISNLEEQITEIDKKFNAQTIVELQSKVDLLYDIYVREALREGARRLPADLEHAITMQRPPELRKPPREQPDLAALLQQARKESAGGRPLAAEQKLREACEQFPNDFEPFEQLTRLYLRAGRRKEAVDFLLGVKEQFIQEVQYFLLLGRAYQELGDLQSALEAKQTAAALAPQDYRVSGSLAFTFWLMRRYREAVVEAEKGLQLAENQGLPPERLIFLKNSLAFYYAEIGDPRDEEKARALIAEVIRAVRDPLKLDTSGYVKLKFARTVADVDEAIRDFNEALSLGLDPEVGAARIKAAYSRRNELLAHQ